MATMKSTWVELGLTKRAAVFSTDLDRLVIDPENWEGKVRVRLDRRINARAYKTVIDEVRDRTLSAVMRDVPASFAPSAAATLKRLAASAPGT